MALYAFDELDSDEDLESNVREFFLAYDDPKKNDDPHAGIGSLYLRGVPRQGNLMGDKIAEAFGIGGHKRIRQALDRLENNIEAGDTTVDIVGFGRSAAIAVSFANEIAARHPDVSVRFVGLFDMVSQFGSPGEHVNAGHNLKLPPNAATVVHAVARDETRSLFPRTSLAPPDSTSERVQEVVFPGNHQDVGGITNLGQDPLTWMREHAVRSGVPFAAPAGSTHVMLAPPLPPEIMKEVYRTPHMDVSVPGPVTPGTRFRVIVSAGIDAPRDGETSMAIAAIVPASATELNLIAWIGGTSHFEFPEPRVKPFVIGLTDAAPTPTVEFDVTVVDPVPASAEARVTVYFVHDGRPCGHVSRGVSVDAPVPEAAPIEATAADAPKPVLSTEISAQRPDLTIEITDQNRDGQHLECRVSSPWLPASANAAPVKWVLPSDTRTLVAGLMQEFVKAGASNKARLLSLRGAGVQLWESAPDEVKEAFWRLIDAGSSLETIFIVSEEPFVPWELMIPHRTRDGSPQFRGPLGVEFAVGRWAPRDHVSPPQEVSLANSLVVAPEYLGPKPKPLAHAAAEATYVISKFPGRRLKPASLEEFDGELYLGFGLLHVVCHGADSAEIGTQRIYLEDCELSSTQVKGMDAFQKGLLGRPLVFLNACEVGRPTTALVGIGGFADAFIKAGASAVIAPLWSVKDVIASEVAREFYEAISADPTVPFARVMQRVRAKAYAAGGGEDTYAAYCYYGDPSAARRVEKAAVGS